MRIIGGLFVVAAVVVVLAGWRIRRRNHLLRNRLVGKVPSVTIRAPGADEQQS